MAESYTEMYLHLVWSTFRRQPLLIGELKQSLYLAIGAECRRLGAPVIALGGIEDHVHLLIRLPATVAVSHLVKQIKGSSSHLIAAPHCGEQFRWQAGYGGFTITKSLVPTVAAYVDKQEQHHQAATTIPALERQSLHPD